MDFFEQQRKARAASKRMVWLFALSVIAVVVIIGLAAGFLTGFAGGGEAPSLEAWFFQRLPIIGLASGLTLLVIVSSSGYKFVSLRDGGGAVAESLGGELLPQDTNDFYLNRLRNVVEEIAIASGTPVPDVYVLPHEEGINAFAAGFTVNDAAIAVTHGTLTKLNRAELQGVIAHEFSHIINGDMRLNLRLMGFLFGLVAISVIGRVIIHGFRWGPHGGWSVGSSDRDGGGKRDGRLMMVGLLLLVVGSVGVFFARMMKASVSRHREVLADASAVQFTRQTEGLAGALKKIAGIQEGSQLQNAHTEEVAHMLFGDGFGSSQLFATHPPILKRIQALDPSFSEAQFAQAQRRYVQHVPDGYQEDLAMGLVGGASSMPLAATTSSSQPTPPVMPQAVPAASVAFASTSALQQQQVQDAAELKQRIPAVLLEAARDHDDSLGIILALLLDDNPSTRDQQIHLVAQYMGHDEGARMAAFYRHVHDLPAELHLPLAFVAFPALRHHHKEEMRRLSKVCDAMIMADGHVSMFEFCLAATLSRQLREAFYPSEATTNGNLTLEHAHDAVVLLLRVMAEHGHMDPHAANKAFKGALSALDMRWSDEYASVPDWSKQLKPALVVLDELQPMAKERLLEALLTLVRFDGQVVMTELELFRVICVFLHCPMPKLLDASTTKPT